MFESNYPVEKLSISYSVLWNAFKLISAERLIPLHPVTQYEGATQLSVGERVVGRESALCLGLSRVAPLGA